MDANTRHIGCSASQRMVGNTTYSGPGPGDGRHLEGHRQADHRLPGQGPDRRPGFVQPLPGAPNPFGGACAAGSPVQTVGYVVTIQADGYYAMKVEGMSLSKGSARTPVDIHRTVRLRTTKPASPARPWTPTSP